MGKFKMRNTFLSSKLKQTKVRLLIIDDNQIRYNQIVQLLTSKGYSVNAHLLDDLKSFEKQLQTSWDVVLFGRAYDLKVEQALSLMHSSYQAQTPLLLLNPQDYDPSQYLSYINRGIYDLFNLDYPDRFYIGLIRTLSYSRALQNQQQLLKELELVDTQIKNQTQENHQATAIIQEGIHLDANQEYLNLFGLSEEDIIGLPLLDVLQPDNLNEFKQKFKRVSNQNFDQARFEINSNNSIFPNNKVLKIEFFPSEDHSLRINIETHTAAEQTIKHYYEPINRKLTNEPANVNALIVFKLRSFDETTLQFNQKQMSNYIEAVQKFIQEQINNIVIKLTPSTYVSLCQSSNNDRLNSKIMGLFPLTKSQLLEVNGNNYGLEFDIGACPLVDVIQDQEEFDFLFAQALSHPIEPETQNTVFDEVETIEFSTLEPEQHVEEKIITEPQYEPHYFAQALEKNNIHLKYQQLYDKHDTNLYIYEVTSGIIHDNQWIDICDANDLIEDPELSIKIDRWILVEACKQLNNFIIQYPTAKLLINLNTAIVNDSQFVSLITKLLSIMSNAHKDALILQFNAKEIQPNPIFATLQSHRIAVSLRHFGSNEQDIDLLDQIKPDLCYLDAKLTKMLNSEKTLTALQDLIHSYQEKYGSDLILSQLDDMNTFANAWNVDARYLQGEYFQKKLDHLIDVN